MNRTVLYCVLCSYAGLLAGIFLMGLLRLAAGNSSEGSTRPQL
jgi:hypothetical protein